VRRQAAEEGARAHYLTTVGERDNIGTRMELVMAHSPFAHRTIDDLRNVEAAIRDSLPEKMREEAQLWVVGTTASVRDLAAVTQRDRRRIEILVLASVFVVLVLLLRTIVLPIYLLLSVLFSYYATLGVSFAVFYLLDPQGFVGIDWKVAIFLFTILIAVGEDYNIFLITRVHEEEKRHGPIHGVVEALTRTGPIISSCGLIMAGTFASLLSASLIEMRQLGFALVFGVLLDTFVVRPILLPAFLILRRRGWRGEADEKPVSP
jgi:RND superfamily putative drug exporter